MYNKTTIEFGFCDIRNNQGLGKCNQARPDILDITKTSSNYCLKLLNKENIAIIIIITNGSDYCV